MSARVIRETDTLNAFIDSLKGAEFVTIDTEFMRERTYWPQLCLIQIGGPDDAVAIDPLAKRLDLTAFWDLLSDREIIKVVHSGRQDIEIFFHETGEIPAPLFDTQVAAMVCGFGESVGYDALIKRLLNRVIDKGRRFTDWSARPLSEAQIAYAIGDVTHLRDAYPILHEQLHKNGRESWVGEEMAVLTDPNTYQVDPRRAWERMKPKSDKPRYLAVLRELAAWRELEAQRKNVPRARILKDETLMDIAALAPTSKKKLAKARGMPAGYAEGRAGQAVIDAVEMAMALPESQLPLRDRNRDFAPGTAPITELLKVLLKLRCEEHRVAAKLVATSEDLKRIAANDDADVLALSGWRREVFGEDALALKHGKLALRIHKKRVQVVDVSETPAPSKKSGAKS